MDNPTEWSRWQPPYDPRWVDGQEATAAVRANGRERTRKDTKGARNGWARKRREREGTVAGVKGRHEFEPLSYAVLGACIDVQRELGVHCREVDYQRALEVALGERGLHCEREVEVPVKYGDRIVAALKVDFRVWDGRDQLLLEVKARPRLLREDGEQCLRYLQQGCYRICLLVNLSEMPFGRRRFVYTPPEKPAS